MVRTPIIRLAQSVCTFLLCVYLIGCQKQRTGENQFLCLNLYCEPPTLDPRKATDSTSINVLISLFEGLTRLGFDHRPHLALAKEVIISKDKLTYTFKLRDAFWSDGVPLSAKDFVVAWSSLLDPLFPAPFAYKLFGIKNANEIKEGKKSAESLGVRALDKRTLEIQLSYPIPYFLELLSLPTFFPIPSHLIQKDCNWADETKTYVSNGPFVLKEWDHENEMTLTKNLFYWDHKNVILEKLRFSMIDDTATEFYMFESGDLDWAGSPLSNLPVDSIATLIEKNALFSYPIFATYFYKINTTSFPCTNVDIRKALCYAINRQEIVDHILQCGQIPATCLIPPQGNDPTSFFKDGDTNKAKEYFIKGLHTLGLSKEEFPVLKLSYNTNREHQKIAQVIQQQWKETLGIQVELENFDWKSYLSKLNRMDYQIGRSIWTAEFNDPISFLYPFEKKDPPEGGMNETGWEHPLFKSLLAKATYEHDEKKRAGYLIKAEELFLDEMPIIPLYFIVFSYVKKPYVKDVYLSPTGTVDYKWAWIDVRMKEKNA